jgi:hypothetical protein
VNKDATMELCQKYVYDVCYVVEGTEVFSNKKLIIDRSPYFKYLVANLE